MYIQKMHQYKSAIGCAIESHNTLGIIVVDHFRELTKMIALAKGPYTQLNYIFEDIIENIKQTK